MSTQTDWSRELDAAIPHAPDRMAGDYVGAGRAAVRRRRLAVAAAGLATAAVVAGVVWVASPGAGPARTGAPFATQPADPSATASPSSTATPTTAPVATRPEDVRAAEPGEVEDFASDAMAPVTALGNGELVRKATWRVVQLRVLLDKGDRRRAWGICAVPDAGGDAVWMILTWRPGSAGSVSDPEGKRFSQFDDWVDTTWAEQQGKEVPRIAWTVDGELAVDPGVDVLETTAHPREASAYGPVDEQVAAKVRLGDGSVAFLIAGPEGATIVDPAVLAAPTMDAFLVHLAAQGDSGEGLR